MNSGDYFTGRLLFNTSRKIRGLQESFKASLVGEEERATARAIFTLVNRICNSLLRRLTAISFDLRAQDESQAYHNEIRMISYMSDTLIQTYELVRNSRSMGHLDFIVRPLEGLVKAVHFDSRILVSSVSDYNYTYDELISVSVDPLKNVQGVFEQGLMQDDVPRKIVKLGFPLAELGNVLSYSGLAHEISHFIFEVEHLQDEYSVEYSSQQYDTIQRIISEVATKPQKPLLREIEHTETVEEITAIVHSWIKETVCDCLAVHVMGPAFLFTLYETLSLVGDVYRWKASSNRKYYPPPIVRFSHALKALESISPFDWDEIIKGTGGQHSRGPEIRDAVTRRMNHIAEISKLEKLTLDAKHKLALDLAETALRKMHEEKKFKKWTEKISFPVNDFHRELLNLEEKLDKNIPINESGYGSGCRVVPDFRVILNVGWIHHLVLQTPSAAYEKELDAEPYDRFELKNRVLRKSLELAQFDTLFHRGKQNGSGEK